MPTYRIQTADGRAVRIQADDPTAAMRAARQWAAANPHKPNVGDLALQANQGLVDSTLGNAEGALQTALGPLAGPFMGAQRFGRALYQAQRARHDPNTPPPTGADVAQAIRALTATAGSPDIGELRPASSHFAPPPRTTSERFARVLGEMAPNALAPGASLGGPVRIAARAAGRVLAPAVGTVGAQEATRSAGGGPIAQSLAGMLGGAATGIGAGAFETQRPPPEAWPTLDPKTRAWFDSQMAAARARALAAGRAAAARKSTPPPAAKGAPAATAASAAPSLPPTASGAVDGAGVAATPNAAPQVSATQAPPAGGGESAAAGSKAGQAASNRAQAAFRPAAKAGPIARFVADLTRSSPPPDNSTPALQAWRPGMLETKVFVPRGPRALRPLAITPETPVASNDNDVLTRPPRPPEYPRIGRMPNVFELKTPNAGASTSKTKEPPQPPHFGPDWLRPAPTAAALIGRGYAPTPGQALGNAAGVLEDGATALPILGDAIRDARHRGVVEAYNRDMANGALAPLNETLPASVQVGYDTSNYIRDRIADAAARINIPFDDTFAEQVDDHHKLFKMLSPDMAAKFDHVSRDGVLDPLLDEEDPYVPNYQDGGPVSPWRFQEALERLQANIRAAKAEGGWGGTFNKHLDMFEQQMADLRDRAQNDSSDPLTRVNQARTVLRHIAGANDLAADPSGVFTPREFRASFENTHPPGQDGSLTGLEAGLRRITENVDDLVSSSVTPGPLARRLVAGATLAGATPAFHFISGPVMAGLAAASAPYLRLGRSVPNAFQETIPTANDTGVLWNSNAFKFQPFDFTDMARDAAAPAASNRYWSPADDPSPPN